MTQRTESSLRPSTAAEDIAAAMLLVQQISDRRAAGYLTSPVLEARADMLLRILLTNCSEEDIAAATAALS